MATSWASEQARIGFPHFYFTPFCQCADDADAVNGGAPIRVKMWQVSSGRWQVTARWQSFACLVLENVGFTAQDYGPLLALAFISNLEDAEIALKFYKRRCRLETLFSDEKSRGFHIHKSHLSDPDRISRLLLAACLAFIWTMHLGLSAIVTGQRALIDRTHRQDKSLFRLGLDWLTYLLKWGEPLPLSFFLSPDLLFHENVR